MDQAVTQDPVLRRFRRAVGEIYGDRLQRVVLFGSRARGDARPESDYDVAVFLRDMGDLWDELRPLGVITTDILIDTGAVISAKPFRASDYTDSRPLMREVRRDGLAL